MGEVIPFGKRPPKGGSTLCLNGHHKWVIWHKKQFDPRQGKLLTVWRCERCGVTRSKAL
jgi:hypothetical protein